MGNTNEEVSVAERLSEPIGSAMLRPEQVEALLTISSLLNSDLNAGRVLRDVLIQICSLFRANRAAVFLREQLPTPPDGQSPSEASRQDIGRVLCVASTGLTTDYLDTITAFYENKEFRQLQTLRRPIYIGDARHDSRLNGLRDVNRREGFMSMLTLPLMYHDTLIGVMVLYHDEPHAYTAQETRLLNVFANQAALAITNSRLYEASRQREQEAARLAEVGRLFNASLKTREVLNRVVRAFGELVGNTALIFILQEDTPEASAVAFYSRAAIKGVVRLDSPVKAGLTLTLGEGVVGKAMQTDVPFLMQDNDEINRNMPFVKPQDGVNSLVCVPLKTRGRIIGAIVSYQVMYDQTGPRLDENRLGLAQALADRAAVAIENARLYEAEKREQRVKDEFLTLVSHELNTPLTNIKGYNQLLSKKLEEATRRNNGQEQPNRAIEGLRHYTEVIGGQIDRLQILVSDLRKIPLIETGQLELAIAPVMVTPLAREEVSQLERALQTHREGQPDFKFEIIERHPKITALADREALRRVIQNLLNNAIKFSPSGGIIRIEVSASSNNQAKLSLSDQGLGIADPDLPHIFERFYKTSSHPGRANGLGLGLYISRSLVEAMHGQLNVMSTEGKGSTFVVRLPATPKNDQ